MPSLSHGHTLASDAAPMAQRWSLSSRVSECMNVSRRPLARAGIARGARALMRIAVICVLRLSNYVVCNKKDTREDMRVSTTVLNTHRKRSSGSAVHEHVHEPNGAASFADDSQTALAARSFGSRSVTVTVKLKGRSSSSTRGRYRRSSVPVPSPLPSRADLHRAREAVTDAVSRRVLVDVARVGAISFDKAVRPRDPFAMLLKWQQARRDEAA